MKYLLICIALSSISFPATAAEEDSTLGLGMYLVVSNLERARHFYEELLRADVIVENENFVGFTLDGGLLGLFTEAAFTHELKRGNNAVPYIRVTDIDAEYARVRVLATEMIHDEVLREGPISLFMFTDPDGNVIEFYSVAPIQ